MFKRASTRLQTLCLVAALLVTGSVLAATPASAATLPAPSNLTPNGAVSTGIPTLSWDRVAGATGYDVQVSTSATFEGTPLWSITNTVNSQAVPQAQVPVGVVRWRVRARSGSTPGAWAVASFQRQPVAAPVLTAPANGAALNQPDAPPLLRWSSVAGAISYSIQISTDPLFIDPSKILTKSTKGTSLVLPDLQLPTTYYWQVQAQLSTGLATAYSSPRSYTIVGLSSPERTSPLQDVNVQDAVLDWAPVHGAATYDLQVSTDVGFLTIIDDVTGIKGTRYARPKTLNNDEYFWRVRAVDGSGNKSTWSSDPGDVKWRFQRNWPDQPHLRYPASAATVGDPLYFQWSPVERASSYDFQLSTTPDFTSGVATCPTVHTTFVPQGGPCMPVASGTYYWRVRASDGFPSANGPVTDAISAESRTFTYSPDSVQLTSPAPGETVSVPVLQWEPLPRAAKYKVTISGPSATSMTTTATSFTPRAILSPGSYRWQVQAVSQDGRLGAEDLPGAQRTFTVEAQTPGNASKPEPTGSQGEHFLRFPTLTWTPVTGADNYRILIRRAGAGGFTRLLTSYAYPAGEDSGSTYLAAGDYEYLIEAYHGSTFVSTSSTPGTFTVDAPDSVLDYRAAISGNSMTGNEGTPIDTCDATLPAGCQNLRQTPLLSWDADESAGYYQLYISNDSEMTNVLSGYPVTVTTNMWMNTATLADSQAGKAYFVEVVPCKADGGCAPLAHADHAFNKQSVPVNLDSPAQGADVQDDVTLDWTDYLATEAATPTAGTSLAAPAETEARTYRVQTSTAENFQTIFETAEVDQTTFTSSLRTYPEGPVFWRVQAIDGSGLPLAWSAPRTFVKHSPVPEPASPEAGDIVGGDEPLSWSSLDFAASYEIEVYRDDDDLQGNALNRVVSVPSNKPIAYSPGSPLQASDKSYTWRVRRVDADGRKGGWSALTPFRVTGPTPTLGSPLDDELVPPSDALFTWDEEPGAAQYRYERRAAGDDNTIVQTVTAATGWAPTTAIAAGNWEWRVVCLDANGKDLGKSEWRPFQVIDTPAATTPVAITGSGAIGTALTVDPPTWNLPDVDTTYQWLRGTAPITGATSEVYELTKDDVGKQISVRATGTKQGYKSGTSTSSPVTGTAGPAIVASEDPSISGTPKVGQVLTANHGSWPGTPTYTYQWLRNGQVITGSTGSTRQLVATDAGQRISVRVTASTPGYLPGTATSATVAIAKIPSSTVATLSAKKITTKQRGVVSVVVLASGVAGPTGKAQVLVDGKVVTSPNLTTSMRGAVQPKLPKLKKGKHKVVVRYLGDGSVAASSSKTVTLTVTKAK